MILEADEVVGVGHQGPVAWRVYAPPRQFFDGQARLEPARLLEPLQRHALRADERLVEARVLPLVHWAVEVVVAALPVARRAEGYLRVDRVGRDDGRNGVVEVEASPFGEPRDLLGERVGAERAGGDYGRRFVINARRLLADDAYVRVRADKLRDTLGELVAVDGERRAHRHAR